MTCLCGDCLSRLGYFRTLCLPAFLESSRHSLSIASSPILLTAQAFFLFITLTCLLGNFFKSTFLGTSFLFSVNLCYTRLLGFNSELVFFIFTHSGGFFSRYLTLHAYVQASHMC